MNAIKISYDDQGYRSKPSGNEIGRINNVTRHFVVDGKSILFSTV